jgi:DMSO reductase anchor subunit
MADIIFFTAAGAVVGIFLFLVIAKLLGKSFKNTK